MDNFQSYSQLVKKDCPRKRKWEFYSSNSEDNGLIWQLRQPKPDVPFSNTAEYIGYIHSAHYLFHSEWIHSDWPQVKFVIVHMGTWLLSSDRRQKLQTNSLRQFQAKFQASFIKQKWMGRW